MTYHELLEKFKGLEVDSVHEKFIVFIVPHEDLGNYPFSKFKHKVHNYIGGLKKVIVFL